MAFLPRALQSPGKRPPARTELASPAILTGAMQFEYDPERLIEEVKKRPGIWDYDDENYRWKESRHKLWQEIVEELLPTDFKVTKSERRELELQLQKKWKSLRDCFNKYLHNPNRTKRPYIYYKQLSFLMKSLDRSEANEGSSGSEDGPRKWKTKKKLKIAKDESSHEEDNDNDVNFTEETIDFTNDDNEMTAQSSKTSKSNKTLDEFAFANVDAKTDSDDSDRMFLLSLLPHLKAIPEEYRLDAKLEMMQVLRNKYYVQNKLI